MRTFNKDSWLNNNTGGWYSISSTSPYESSTQIVGKQTVTMHTHKCVGCARKFKTMQRRQSYCSTACYALGNRQAGKQPTGPSETIEVSIIGPPRKSKWSIDRRKKSISDIRDIQEVLTDSEV